MQAQRANGSCVPLTRFRVRHRIRQSHQSTGFLLALIPMEGERHHLEAPDAFTRRERREGDFGIQEVARLIQRQGYGEARARVPR